ncbi:MAG: hypothetical protein JO092_07550, partial [Candidatus Eremiobacteraeota bacterium]|nr:hypothetical protein [Candidatus Eremiobacteraeota bacterium]
DKVLIPFSLAFTAFLFLVFQSMRTNDAPAFVYIPLLLFVAVAAYLLGGRFFYDAFRRSQLCYGLTNRQVVIVHGNVGPTTQCLDLSTLPAMTLVPDGGAASIWFGTPPTGLLPGVGITDGQGRLAAPYFDRIEDAQRVREQILSAQSATQAK